MLEPAISHHAARPFSRYQVPLWLTIILCIACMSLVAFVQDQASNDPRWTEDAASSVSDSLRAPSVFQEPQPVAAALMLQPFGEDSYIGREAPSVSLEIVPDSRRLSYPNCIVYNDCPADCPYHHVEGVSYCEYPTLFLDDFR